MGDDTSIAVFERSSSLRKIGGQVGLFAPAFQAMNCLDPSGDLSSAIVDAGVQRTMFRLLDMEGTVVSETPEEKTKDMVAIPWFKLQRVLLDAFTTLEEQNKNEDVLLSFRNGHQYRAKIVIGADGNLSRVRSTLFEEEDTIPEYSGSCVWRMFLSGEYDGINAGECNVWTGDGKVLTVQKMGSGDDCRLYVSGLAGWPKDQLNVLDRKRYIGSEDGEDSGGSTNNEDRIERFLKTFEDFPPKLLDFVKQFHDTASILEHPVYFRPVGREWGKGRVTLVGDAAHMIPPNMAMGTPLAFEDSVSLAHSIRTHGLSNRALRAYEKERQPRVNQIAYKTIKNAGSYYTDKDDDANPFKINDDDKAFYESLMNFKQEPIPTSTGTVSNN
ncbi:FAD/NAD(P)-binding domain-containing protein [Fragilariopsis cylindrus CCMP1102]|uniref:FAD/NAD(P)-binding domain-containing protein n=1 Tax=Fragilariopsis cylindrus CCMP1102 TaxID=635003 RepID=A0A1E7EZQ7_9STRA|nr:FAD/NAD(P)-binding domain-containing protein [Fragilariopsis cylindrus CCMP1102]|eukprot:OEU11336.1 FAD/NAD(P)-binding domain-containing protein [Fragilariopsis cylindrus CCMP1102]